MDAPILKAHLRNYRSKWLEQQCTHWTNHWIQRIASNVIELAKNGKIIYTHAFTYAMGGEESFPMEEPLPKPLVEYLVTGIVAKFPDSTVTFQNDTLTIDWSS